MEEKLDKERIILKGARPRDKKMNDILYDMLGDIRDWREFVARFGNPCAVTDRIIEKIIGAAHELEKVYEGASDGKLHTK